MGQVESFTCVSSVVVWTKARGCLIGDSQGASGDRPATETRLPAPQERPPHTEGKGVVRILGLQINNKLQNECTPGTCLCS